MFYPMFKSVAVRQMETPRYIRAKQTLDKRNRVGIGYSCRLVARQCKKFELS